jgi:hypothetical protein
VPADTPIEDLMQRWAITRNGVKKRAVALGVELLRPDRDSCLWPSDALELAEQLDSHLKAGKPVRTFPGLPRSTETQPVAQPAPAPVTSLSKRPQPGAPLVAAPEQLAALVAALRPHDPLSRPEALARAADAGHWLSTAELADVVGMAAGSVRSWKTGQSPRPGFELERRHEAGRVWWKVIRQ